MDFEEFFRKKKIDLAALEQGEPTLFSEFKIHFGQMGEKSFDHTKKYWFNKLRLRFPAPVEAKVERVVIENQLAEQTVNESLIESSSPPPNIGFKPKFRAGVTKPVEETHQPKEDTEQPSTPPPNVGFKPRFKAGVTKSAEETPKTEPTPEKPAENTEQTPPPPPNIGFKPRFKAGVTKSTDPSHAVELTPAPKKPAENTELTAPSAPLGFKPKFKAGVTKTVSPAPEEKEDPKAETPPAADRSTESNETKPAYKPRFNMKNIKPKGEE
jgi:hypothetical protein